jgi:hypothetical protein
MYAVFAAVLRVLVVEAMKTDKRFWTTLLVTVI